MPVLSIKTQAGVYLVTPCVSLSVACGEIEYLLEIIGMIITANEREIAEKTSSI